MKIGITASGHIGNNLCRELNKRGHLVKVLVHIFDKSSTGLDVEKVDSSILDKKTLHTIIEGADYVFHAAASISRGAGQSTFREYPVR